MASAVDFHSHVLPGIDDGSASVEESLALLRMEAEQGIGHVVATPHFYAHYDSPERFLERRAQAEEQLRRAIEQEGGLPRLHIGAEVYFFRGISSCEDLPRLTIDGTRFLLVEMPQPPWTDSMYRELEGIYSRQGLVPILAHIDRYIRPLKTYGIPRRLEKLPVLVQANGEFFLTGSTRRMALTMLKKDKIHLLGSDCHNLRSRKPNLGETLELISRKAGAGSLDRISGYARDILDIS